MADSVGPDIGLLRYDEQDRRRRKGGGSTKGPERRTGPRTVAAGTAAASGQPAFRELPWWFADPDPIGVGISALVVL